MNEKDNEWINGMKRNDMTWHEMNKMKRMNEWMNEWINKWMNERMNGINGRNGINGMNGRKKGVNE